ncbi:MAG TPA: hypothetical protein VHD39_04050, partial [Acidimicrobiales bacterium]|nr:hypothetical protein [Acidimicrobiales bacterium]
MSGGSLAATPRLLRTDPAVAAMVGGRDVTIAVPEAAQAVAVAALAAFTERTPLLVVTATGLDAERLGDDLTCLLPDDGGGGGGGGGHGGGGGGGDVVGALRGPVAV